MADGQAAGLCHYGRRYAWLGVTQAGGVRHIVWSANGAQTAGVAVTGSEIWLRSLISDAGEATWVFSFDGRVFTPFGGPYKLEWAHYRGDRIGIFSYNDEADEGFVDVDEFQYILAGARKP